MFELREVNGRLMKHKKGFRGIRKRWMVNSISVVLFIVLLAVSAFSAAMGSYYYSTLSESLSQKAENAVQSFNYFQSGGSYYDYARSMVSGDPPATGWRWSSWTPAGRSAFPAPT